MQVGVQRGSLAKFHEFLLDMRTGELRHESGKVIRLPEQSFQILVMLLERPGEVVSREEIRKRLWPNGTVVEFEHSISAAMNRLRQPLGDSAGNPIFIETLAKRGYRFVAPVTRDGYDKTATPTKVDPLPSSAASVVVPFPSSDEQTQALPRRRRYTVTGIVITLLILFGASFLVMRHQLSRTQGISFETLEMTKLTDNGAVKNVAISGDGRYIAYAAFLGEKQTLRLRQVATCLFGRPA